MNFYYVKLYQTACGMMKIYHIRVQQQVNEKLMRKVYPDCEYPNWKSSSSNSSPRPSPSETGDPQGLLLTR